MFCSEPYEPHGATVGGARLRDRARHALRLLGAFLTLEDTYDVDWAFPEARSVTSGRSQTPRRPHTLTRAAGSRGSARRAGAPVPVAQPCRSPLTRARPATQQHRTSAGR